MNEYIEGIRSSLSERLVKKIGPNNKMRYQRYGQFLVVQQSSRFQSRPKHPDWEKQFKTIVNDFRLDVMMSQAIGIDMEYKEAGVIMWTRGDARAQLCHSDFGSPICRFLC